MIEEICDVCGNEAIFEIMLIYDGNLYNRLYCCEEHLYSGCENFGNDDRIVNLSSKLVYRNADDAYFSVDPVGKV